MFSYWRVMKRYSEHLKTHSNTAYMMQVLQRPCYLQRGLWRHPVYDMAFNIWRLLSTFLMIITSFFSLKKQVRSLVVVDICTLHKLMDGWTDRDLTCQRGQISLCDQVLHLSCLLLHCALGPPLAPHAQQQVFLCPFWSKNESCYWSATQCHFEGNKDD